MPCPTLVSMATRTAMKNIDDITDMAEMSYALAQPILKKVKTAEQLRALEVTSPQLADHDANLWISFIKRDCPQIAQNPSLLMSPSNPRSWWKVYRKYHREELERAAVAEAALRAELLGAKVKKAENRAVFVPEVMYHARDEKESNVFVDGVLKKSSNNRTSSNSTQSVKSAKTGTAAIAAIRKQTAMNHRQRLATNPFKVDRSALLEQNRRQIKQAPESMLRQVHQPPVQNSPPRELLPPEKLRLREQARERENFRRTVKIQAPGLVCNAKYAAVHEKQNVAAIQRAREVEEVKLRQLTQSQKAVTKEKPAPRFGLKSSPAQVEDARSVIEAARTPSPSRPATTKIARPQASIFAPARKFRR